MRQKRKEDHEPHEKHERANLPGSAQRESPQGWSRKAGKGTNEPGANHKSFVFFTVSIQVFASIRLMLAFFAQWLPMRLVKTDGRSAMASVSSHRRFR